MRDIWPQLRSWVERGEPFAVATVVATKSSSPRGVGSCLAVAADGRRFLGSVSAGCVESEVIEAARLTVADGRTRRLAFGPETGYPWEVALSCGGAITVRVDRYPAFDPAAVRRGVAQGLERALAEDRPAVLVWGEGESGLVGGDGAWYGSEHWPAEIVALARELWSAPAASREVEVAGTGFFLHVLEAAPRLFVIGATHVAVHLVTIAKSLGWETAVIDPREDYARAERFLTAPDRLLVAWPDAVLRDGAVRPGDALAALTHDPKIDDPALREVLTGPCGYVGALGSRRSHGARLRRLAAAGVPAEDLARIRGPIGLDIGGRTPAEIAVSIAAEIIAHWSHAKPEARP